MIDGKTGELFSEAQLVEIRSLHLQARNGKTPIGGQQHELDFIVLGRRGGHESVVEIVSAKSSGASIHLARDRTNFRKILSCPPNRESGLEQWLFENCGDGTGTRRRASTR